MIVDDRTPFERWHENCPAAWECFSCGKAVCPACEPSKGEFTLCAGCHWFFGGDDAA